MSESLNEMVKYVIIRNVITMFHKSKLPIMLILHNNEGSILCVVRTNWSSA